MVMFVVKFFEAELQVGKVEGSLLDLNGYFQGSDSSSRKLMNLFREICEHRIRVRKERSEQSDASKQPTKRKRQGTN